MKKLVSVVVPAYNAEVYLAETISSVLNQTYQNLEVILVDDGSSDTTAQIALSFSGDTRFHYIFQKNAGVSAARNKGYRESKGEYLAFLDADDLWLPNCLEERVKILDANPAVGLVHTDMVIIDEKGVATGQVLQGKEGRILDELLLWNNTCIPAPSSILVPRSVLEAVGLFDTDLSTAADQEFFFRVAHRYPIARIPKPLGLYRIHGTNMHQNIALMERDHTLAYRKAAQHNFFKSKAFKKRAFSNLYLILAGSWWVSCRNKPKTAEFLLKSFLYNPLNLKKILQKVLAPKAR